MNKAELIRHKIEKRRDHNLAIGNPLFTAMAEEDIELLSFINSLQEDTVSEELEVELEKYIKDHFTIDTEQLDRFGIEEKDYMYSMDKSDMLALVEHFTKWQKVNLWKPADGDDLPKIDREAIVFTQPYPLEESEYEVSFAHRPNKYAKVWNSDLGEEQIVEIERYGKGEWNIPDVKWWLDVELPKEKEL